MPPKKAAGGGSGGGSYEPSGKMERRAMGRSLKLANVATPHYTPSWEREYHFRPNIDRARRDFMARAEYVAPNKSLSSRKRLEVAAVRANAAAAASGSIRPASKGAGLNSVRATSAGSSRSRSRPLTAPSARLGYTTNPAVAQPVELNVDQVDSASDDPEYEYDHTVFTNNNEDLQHAAPAEWTRQREVMSSVGVKTAANLMAVDPRYRDAGEFPNSPVYSNYRAPQGLSAKAKREMRERKTRVQVGRAVSVEERGGIAPQQKQLARARPTTGHDDRGYDVTGGAKSLSSAGSANGRRQTTGSTNDRAGTVRAAKASKAAKQQAMLQDQARYYAAKNGEAEPDVLQVHGADPTEVYYREPRAYDDVDYESTRHARDFLRRVDVQHDDNDDANVEPLDREVHWKLRKLEGDNTDDSDDGGEGFRDLRKKPKKRSAKESVVAGGDGISAHPNDDEDMRDNRTQQRAQERLGEDFAAVRDMRETTAAPIDDRVTSEEMEETAKPARKKPSPKRRKKKVVAQHADDISDEPAADEATGAPKRKKPTPKKKKKKVVKKKKTTSSSSSSSSESDSDSGSDSSRPPAGVESTLDPSVSKKRRKKTKKRIEESSSSDDSDVNAVTSNTSDEDEEFTDLRVLQKRNAKKKKKNRRPMTNDDADEFDPERDEWGSEASHHAHWNTSGQEKDWYNARGSPTAPKARPYSANTSAASMSHLAPPHAYDPLLSRYDGNTSVLSHGSASPGRQQVVITIDTPTGAVTAHTAPAPAQPGVSQVTYSPVRDYPSVDTRSSVPLYGGRDDVALSPQRPLDREVHVSASPSRLRQYAPASTASYERPQLSVADLAPPHPYEEPPDVPHTGRVTPTAYTPSALGGSMPDQSYTSDTYNERRMYPVNNSVHNTSVGGLPPTTRVSPMAATRDRPPVDAYMAPPQRSPLRPAMNESGYATGGDRYHVNSGYASSAGYLQHPGEVQQRLAGAQIVGTGGGLAPSYPPRAYDSPDIGNYAAGHRDRRPLDIRQGGVGVGGQRLDLEAPPVMSSNESFTVHHAPPLASV